MKDDMMISRKQIILSAAFLVLGSTAACLPESASSQASVKGVYCEGDTKERQLKKTLLISQEEGSPDLFVGLDYWSPEGHNCSLTGPAKKAADNSWILQQQNPSDGKSCEITLTTDANGNFEIRQGGENCSDFCGARLSFGTQTIAATSKTTDTVLSDQIKNIGEQNFCP